MELKLEFSSARNWISGLKGVHSSVENQQTCEKGKKPSTSFEASSLKKSLKKSQQRFSRGESCCCNSSKGTAVLQGSEVEELNERLKVLEEETEMMKETFFWSLEERKVMMNEIYKQFQLLHGCLKPGTLVIEESSIVNPFEVSNNNECPFEIHF